ncbi:MAG: class A beta-lactamase-related serine hydrolase [Bifidobacterium sp.]|jgi:beta-lactamase class A|nr:class A beta-lactamase-related serine hydrolase [Bifidobacterium sp.]MCI1865300.1 class A beta-lactamase-related serine hydrolase [Bifidobacterium sp.]
MVTLDSRVHWSIDVVRVGGAGADPAPRVDALAELNAHDSLRTASIGKLFLLAELMRQVEAGMIGLNDVVSRDDERPDDFMEDSGILYMLDQRTFTVADLAVMVGACSDNYATNLLVERVGLSHVQRCARETLGYTRSTLLDKVRMTRRTGPDLPDDMSRGSADELCDYMVRLSRGTMISRGASSRIERWLGADFDTSMASGAFCVDPLAHWPYDGDFLVRHKTGTESDVRCDVGMVTARSTGITVAYAILANWDKSAYGDLREPVLDDMRRLGMAIRRYVCTRDRSDLSAAQPHQG